LPNSTLSGIDFRNPMQGVITVTSFTTTISYKTSDGGATWAWLDTLPYFAVTDLVLTANTGYLAGEFGKLYKLDGLLGVAAPSLGQMRAFPNPILPGQMLQWEAEAQPTHASLVDMAGRTLHQTELHQPCFRMPELAPGIYFLRLETDLGVRSSKIIVE
jgi:hypothetical protein